MLWLASRFTAAKVYEPPRWLTSRVKPTDNHEELVAMGRDPLMVWGARSDTLYGLVAMMERAIKSACPSGGLVVEPFGGSGATLMGAEKTGRVCYTMEMQPHYVDVIVRRWQDWRGQEAYREADAVKFNDLAALAGMATPADSAEANA